MTRYVHLRHVGKVAAIPAAEVEAGMVMRYNDGYHATVANVEHGGSWVWITTADERSPYGDVNHGPYTHRCRPTTLVPACWPD